MQIDLDVENVAQTDSENIFFGSWGGKVFVFSRKILHLVYSTAIWSISTSADFFFEHELSVKFQKITNFSVLLGYALRRFLKRFWGWVGYVKLGLRNILISLDTIPADC